MERRTGPAAAFSAVAFDLDGTLYPNRRLYARLVPFALRRGRFLAAFGRARELLRAEDAAAGAEDAAGGAKDFREEPFALRQARALQKILRDSRGAEELAGEIRRLIYDGWEPLFQEIAPCPGVRETLGAFREAGLALGVLSDFPLGRKLEYLGLGGLWDAAFSSEDAGRLKPHPRPFLELARRLGVLPERVLYVGNSFSCDVTGALGAGMGAAWFVSRGRFVAGRAFPGASRLGRGGFAFCDYRQLRRYVLS